MVLAIVYDLEEDVHDLFLDVGPYRHELTKNAVQNGFQIVPLPRVLAVEKLEETVDKLV